MNHLTTSVCASNVYVCYLDIPNAHSSIHAGGAELGALVSSSFQHRDFTEIFVQTSQSNFVYQHLRLQKNPRNSVKQGLNKLRSHFHYSDLILNLTAWSKVQIQMFLLPDAVPVQGFQVRICTLGLWGPTVQILETFPGTDALLGCLLRDVQLATKCQAAFGAIIHKQHRVTVMALEKQKGISILIWD